MDDDGNDFDLSDMLNSKYYGYWELSEYIDNRYGPDNESLFELINLLFDNIDNVNCWYLVRENLEKFNATIMSDDEIMKIFNLIAERIVFIKTTLKQRYLREQPELSLQKFIKLYNPMDLLIELHYRFGISKQVNTYDGNTLLIMIAELEPEQIDYDYLDEWFDPEINEHLMKSNSIEHYNINYRNPITGLTALHCAIIHNHPRLIKLLLNNGANPSIPNNEGLTASDLLDEYYYDLYNPDNGTVFAEFAKKYEPIMRKFGKRSKRRKSKKKKK